MGKLRSDSERMRRTRLKLDAEERDTLMPCVACQGEGKRLVESGGRYRMWSCPWCAGSGATTAVMIAAFSRMLRIVQWARVKGRACEPRVPA